MSTTYVERRELVQRLLKQKPNCEACRVFASHDGKTTFIQKPSVDLHELVRRSHGGSITDENNIITVCRDCHRRIGEHPQLAFDLGLAKHDWD